MAFTPVTDTRGKLYRLPVAASTTITKGNALTFSGGYATNATNATTQVDFVAAETVDNSAGSAGDKEVVAILAHGVIFEGPTNSTAAQTMVGTKIDLSTAAVLDESTSADDVFFVTEFVSTSVLRGIFSSNPETVTADIGALSVTTAKIAADAVDGTKIADDAVSLEHLDSGITPSHIVVYAGEFTTAGGDTDETISVPGVVATDLVHVTLHTAGASPVTIIDAQAGTDQIDVDMSADPSTDHVLTYSVLRAVA